jgi:Flp pilus assembly protein TadB
MELDELKTTWIVLEKQLKKNETLNKQLLSEMLHKKSNKSLNKLVNTDFIGIIIFLAFIPYCIWLYNANHYYLYLLSVNILSVVCGTVSVIGIVWYYYKLKYLMKIDFSKSVKDNMYCANRYGIMVRREKMITYYILIPVISFLVTFCVYEFKAGISLWTLVIVAVAIGIIITFWMYKKIYDPNVQSIKQKLDELKELDEIN